MWQLSQDPGHLNHDQVQSGHSIQLFGTCTPSVTTFSVVLQFLALLWQEQTCPAKGVLHLSVVANLRKYFYS
jgi:hypothetical protein